MLLYNAKKEQKLYIVQVTQTKYSRSVSSYILISKGEMWEKREKRAVICRNNGHLENKRLALGFICLISK